MGRVMAPAKIYHAVKNRALPRVNNRDIGAKVIFVFLAVSQKP